MDDNRLGLLVLDPVQLVRIEAVHRGYLYQHLYAAQCLLAAASLGATSVSVEGDEDIEIEFPGKKIYVQVKHRIGLLSWNDIEGALERFGEIRLAHAQGRRKGNAEFVVMSNAPPNGPLAEWIAEKDWPGDVRVDWPAADRSGRELPAPRATLLEAAEAVRALASGLPFGKLSPETLVWKLAGIVMLAATGEDKSIDHVFLVGTLPGLFEQMALQLQDLPLPPSPYRVQEGEPGLTSGNRVRMIAGYSGAGKTSWLAQAAQHAPGPLVYIDVGDIPGAGIASTIARELAGRLFGGGGNLGEILLPGASGREVLLGISRRIADSGLKVTIALDNAHRAPADDVAAVVKGAAGANFVLLCRPEGETAAIEAMLQIHREELSGWGIDTVAAAAADFGCKADVADCQRLIDLTGGLPLYVLSALDVVKSDYDGNVRHFCADLAQAAQTREIAQESILAQVFDRLPKALADIADMLSLCDAPIKRDDAVTFVAAPAGLGRAATLAALRQLHGHGLLQIYGGDKVKIHDAARVVGRSRIALIGEAALKARRQALRAIVSSSLAGDWSPAKLALLLRLAGEVGDVEFLAEVATEELFHEMGVWPEVEAFLVLAADDESHPPDQRIKVLDALAFAYLKSGSQDAEPVLAKMDEVIEKNGLGAEEVLRVGMKRLLVLGKKGDRTGTYALANTLTEAAVGTSPAHKRVLAYNIATAELALGDGAAVIRRVEPLIKEYYGLIGITPRDVMGRNAPDLLKIIPKTKQDADSFKHLADSLDVLAKAMDKEGKIAPFARIHALKFYDLARAPESIFRVGQDLVDQFLQHHDFEGAREFMEATLIPQMRQYKIADYVISVRSQYAVVLAYCGKFADAEREMTGLQPYETGLDARQRGELANQKRLIAELRRFGPPPAFSLPPGKLEQIRERIRNRDFSDLEVGQPRRHAKIGRNEPCPCGSGKKYKACHGRA